MAFAKAKVSDKLSLRVGSLGLPVFMISDYRNVGYADTLLRPPTGIYARVSTNHIDGADATWQQGFGDTIVWAQLAYGRSRSEISERGSNMLHLVTALNLVAEHGPLTLRVRHVHTPRPNLDARRKLPSRGISSRCR